MPVPQRPAGPLGRVSVAEIARLTEPEFAKLGRKLLAGLGIRRPRRFEAPGVECAFRVRLVRESTDKMFRTEETWLCVFERPSGAIDIEKARAVADAAIAANVRALFLAPFGPMAFEAEERLRDTLAQQGIEAAILAGPLAECLAPDYGDAGHLDGGTLPPCDLRAAAGLHQTPGVMLPILVGGRVPLPEPSSAFQQLA